MPAAHPSSFRDPSGFVFSRGGTLFRQINRSYRGEFERLMASGLYSALTEKGLLIPHEAVDEPLPDSALGHAVIKPRLVPFISYPFEWCFGQLQAAALASLAVQELALGYGMSLKDASAYNIQFVDGKPLFIDTLSFETYTEGRPWAAYRQFCQHFLAPLALMAYGHIRHGLLSRIHLDGIPLDLAGDMLPWRTRLDFSIFTHVHLHGWLQSRRKPKMRADREPKGMGKRALLGMIDSLKSAVAGLSLPVKPSVWAGYYSETNYSTRAFEHKQQVVARYLDRTRSATVWDLGANTGLFSRIAASQGRRTLAFDLDPLAVERNFAEVTAGNEKNLLPLVMDLANPTPGLGWENRERLSLEERGPADTLLALALIHHLAIGNNLPLEHIARFFARLGRFAVVEFVPKSDSQVRRLLASRADIFPDFNQEGFLQAFGKHFKVLEKTPLEDSERCLFLLEKRDGGP